MKSLPIFIFVFLIAGCTTKVGRELKMDDILKIERGTSTKQDILKAFGPAMQTTHGATGDIWSYLYSDDRNGLARSTTRMDTLVITFNGEVVKDYSTQFSMPQVSGNSPGN